jgi:hypothetical protein
MNLRPSGSLLHRSSQNPGFVLIFAIASPTVLVSVPAHLEEGCSDALVIGCQTGVTFSPLHSRSRTNVPNLNSSSLATVVGPVGLEPTTS